MKLFLIDLNMNENIKNVCSFTTILNHSLVEIFKLFLDIFLKMYLHAQVNNIYMKHFYVNYQN